MSRPAAPALARPFASFLYVDDGPLRQALDMMDKYLGERCFTSDATPFNRTDYYRREMGDGILRIFAAWKKLVDPSEIIAIKKRTWDIEEELKADAPGRKVNRPRPVNIDPGLIEEGRMALATGKPAAHRPYLGEGLYIDLTLVFERKSYRPLPWTYPDYADKSVIKMLNELRAQYLADRKEMRKK